MKNFLLGVLAGVLIMYCFNSRKVLSAKKDAFMKSLNTSKLVNASKPIIQGSVDSLSIWASADSHIPNDLTGNYKSLAVPIAQSEFGDSTGAVPFNWDIALHLGDYESKQGLPTDAEGVMVKEQLHSAKLHSREQIYSLIGNHDSSGSESPENWWFRKWVDPMGRNFEYSGVDSTKRPYKIHGNYHSYYFEVGNLMVIMLGDRNEGNLPAGRGAGYGGAPAGKVTLETFNWWKNLVEENQDKIIITCAHHMLRNTTTATGRNQGHPKYHGESSEDDKIGSSYLYFVGDSADAEHFHHYLDGFYQQNNRGAIAMWLGGHTHLRSPVDSTGGKKPVAERYGVTFMNVAALTIKHHGTYPTSRMLNFVHGSDSVQLRMYLHNSGFAPVGWYNPFERYVKLPHFFAKDGVVRNKWLRKRKARKG